MAGPLEAVELGSGPVSTVPPRSAVSGVPSAGRLGGAAEGRHGVGPGGDHHADLVASAQAESGANDPDTTRLHSTSSLLSARAGLQRIEVGVVTSYSSGPNTARVRLSGSQANVVGPLPVGLGLAAAAPGGNPVGSRCLVVLLDESNPNDAIVVALY